MRDGEDPFGGRTPTDHERRAGRPWDASYSDGAPPWDLGRPQAAVVRLVDEGAFVGTVLDAGCGSGENALCVAQGGHDVLGFDVAETAIAQAREKARARGLTAAFRVADALALTDLGQTFDSALDAGLLHCLDDAERRRYVDGLRAVLRPGGRFHLLCFSDAAPGDDGPRHLSEADLRATFALGWRVVSIAEEWIETNPDWIGDDAPPWVRDGGAPAWLARLERTPVPTIVR